MIGERLKDYRLLFRLTGSTLAGLSGIKQSYLSQIENKKKYPPMDTFINIVTALAKVGPLNHENHEKILNKKNYYNFKSEISPVIKENEKEDSSGKFTVEFFNEDILLGRARFYTYPNAEDIERVLNSLFLESWRRDIYSQLDLKDEAREYPYLKTIYETDSIKESLYVWWYNHILEDIYGIFNTGIKISDEEMTIFVALMSLINPDGTFTPYNKEDITNIPKSLLSEKIVTFDIGYIKDKNLRLTLDGTPLSNQEIEMLDVSLNAIRYKREQK